MPKSITAQPIRVAFVGAGTMARHHLQALRRVRTPHIVVAVCDRDARVARETAAMVGAAAFTDLQKLLAEATPDVVHVCTPAGRHGEPARAALEAGAHIYVEKPFVESELEAAELLALAARQGRLTCVGHQQVRDPAYTQLLHRLADIGTVVRIDSDFTFQPVGLVPGRAGPRAVAAQLLDVLPHPLSALMWTLERVCPDPAMIELVGVLTEPSDLHAVIRGGECWGRLSVSLRSRPIVSTLSVLGTGGTLTADFMRATVIGSGNPGTGPLEKAANPLLEGWQMAASAVRGVTRRLQAGSAYSGLAELIGDFYAAVAGRRPAPFPADHLRRLTAIYEELAANVRGAAERATVQRPTLKSPAGNAPLAVLTGARGFFGKEIARALAQRGFRVRGISRTADFDDPHVHEWRAVDLSRPVACDAFADAAIVIHAAAAAAGGFEDHQRHTIDATRHVLDAMEAAACSRLVYISSLSALHPPRTAGERQDERTALVSGTDRTLGPYAWGKAEAERIVTNETHQRGIETRILRPAALLDQANPELPGFVGRRLFGHWHLGFGRPALPVPVCEVSRAAAVVAWFAAHFEDAPLIVNLSDDAIPNRRALLAYLRSHGWRGRMAWLPISVFASLFALVQFATSIVRRRPPALRVWSLFRPRRYDNAVAARVFATAIRDTPPTSPVGDTLESHVPWRA